LAIKARLYFSLVVLAEALAVLLLVAMVAMVHTEVVAEVAAAEQQAVLAVEVVMA
jgi:hypothetical protein